MKYFVLPVLLLAALAAGADGGFGSIPPKVGSLPSDSLCLPAVSRLDTVWLDSLFGPPGGETTAVCGASVHSSYGTSVVVAWSYTNSDGVVVWEESFMCNVGPGDSAVVTSIPWRVGPPGLGSVLCVIPGDSVVWGHGEGGVADGGRASLFPAEVRPTVMYRLPAGATAFDAMGRRVLNPRPGIYFVRDDGRRTKNEPTRMRKVILQR